MFHPLVLYMQQPNSSLIVIIFFFSWVPGALNMFFRICAIIYSVDNLDIFHNTYSGLFPESLRVTD
jgi:hypothetical protein